MNIVELDKLLADNPPAIFHSFHDFNGKEFGAVAIQGESPVWEMHPDTDEFFISSMAGLTLPWRKTRA